MGKTITANAKITFDDTRVTHVFSPVTGRVMKILAQPGSRVKRGDVLAILASPDLAQAVSDRDKAEADLVAARREYERQEELSEAHAGAQRDLEAAENTFQKVQAERERAREKVRLFSPNAFDKISQDYALRTPIDGEIISRGVEPGMEVNGQYSGGAGAALFTVGELDRVWVVADIYEMDFTAMRMGDPASIAVAALGDQPPLVTTIEWVSSVLDPITHTGKIRCSLPNPKRDLKPEMLATMSIAVGGPDSLSVPSAAVLRLGDHTVVFVKKQALTPQRQVAFTRRVINVDEEGGGDNLRVLDGLMVGERVVTSGAVLLAGMM